MTDLNLSNIFLVQYRKGFLKLLPVGLGQLQKLLLKLGFHAEFVSRIVVLCLPAAAGTRFTCGRDSLPAD